MSTLRSVQALAHMRVSLSAAAKDEDESEAAASAAKALADFDGSYPEALEELILLGEIQKQLGKKKSTNQKQLDLLWRAAHSFSDPLVVAARMAGGEKLQVVGGRGALVDPKSKQTQLGDRV